MSEMTISQRPKNKVELWGQHALKE